MQGFVLFRPEAISFGDPIEVLHGRKNMSVIDSLPQAYFVNSFSIRESGTSHMIATVTDNARAIKGETNANGTAAV